MGLALVFSTVVLWVIVFPLTIYSIFTGYLGTNAKGSGFIQAIVYFFAGLLFITLVNVGVGFFIFQHYEGIVRPFKDLEILILLVLQVHLLPLLIGGVAVSISKDYPKKDELKAWRLNKFGLGIYISVFSFFLQVPIIFGLFK